MPTTSYIYIYLYTYILVYLYTCAYKQIYARSLNRQPTPDTTNAALPDLAFTPLCCVSLVLFLLFLFRPLISCLFCRFFFLFWFWLYIPVPSAFTLSVFTPSPFPPLWHYPADGNGDDDITALPIFGNRQPLKRETRGKGKQDGICTEEGSGTGNVNCTFAQTHAHTHTRARRNFYSLLFYFALFFPFVLFTTLRVCVNVYVFA
ncbi:hypothetical protein, unlikely [Trypanosoma brucei gambiense DAL972]|uniref:Uncharacterized protein n=1 Tax=Trypanosoma brucei gambiense (strain MHOM/CI/86/DAL972) TaxID=679716 RepID=C9ZTU7_TRYB9|nr:hypothetical protein, unlikely [Trypanosoma brucei gambiense DAL972]CBH12833.1 hypothetical protein, unlikely [Trypanosoma brucei gambiense DAL972]|eukprot:XP_011775112.1 hypothetical protein, unlikely [Trypanosoma brucei gambiense DAL972]